MHHEADISALTHSMCFVSNVSFEKDYNEQRNGAD